MKTSSSYVGLLALLLATNLGAQGTRNTAETVPASAAVSFSDNGQKLGTGDSWYIQLVDINGDGRLEAYFDGAIWLNDGQGHFTRSEQSFGPTNRPAYFADLNGDGLIDVVCDDVVHLNDGKFGFSNKRPVPTDIPMLSAHLADLNGDGAVDIIVAGQYEDRILLNDGKGNFRDTRTSLGGWNQCTYAVGDINGDGIPDIYVAIPHTPPPEMKPAQDKIWLGDGHGGYTEAPHHIQVGEHRGVILADLNRDGSLDLLVSGPRGSRVYFNDGKGNFTDSDQPLGAGGAVAGDFDGDGSLDVFFSAGAPTDKGKPNTVWLNDGQGHFTDSGLRLGNANSIAAAVGDLNSDGKPDVFVANVKNVITKEGAGYNEVWLNTTPRPSAPASSTQSEGKAVSTPAALRLDLATFLGGKGEDRAHGMAVDAQGNIYLTAPIGSKDFPTTPDALNQTPTGIYFAKLSPTGALLYSTYLGAAGGNNYAHSVALDKDGCIYIAGNTTNRNFPTTPGAFQTTFKGPSDTAHGDGFVVKLSPAGDRIIYATFLGGSGPDICGKIAVDAEGNAYVLGCTASKDFPVTPGALQTTFKGGEDTPTGRGDLFVAKLSPDGSKLVYCTYVGGAGAEVYGDNIVLDASGAVTFAGATTSSDFPTTANALGKSYRGGSGFRGGGDGVIVRLNPTGTALEYASYIGGSGDDSARSVAVDNAGNIWLAGDTTSADFPATPDAYCRQNKGAADCFLLKLNPRSGALLYSSLLGGGKADNFGTLAVHSSGLLVIAGRTESADFPTTPGADSTTLKGPADLFVALFDPAAKSLRYCTLLGGSGNEVPGPLLLIKDQVYFAGNTTSADFPVTPGAGDTTYNGGTNEWGGDAFVARFTLVGKNGSP